MNDQHVTSQGTEFVELMRRQWRARQITTSSAIAIAAVAAALLMPTSARAADCAADVNPAGSTCETSTGKEITLDGTNTAYNNIGVLDNLVADGVKIDDTGATFTNTGTFNNNLAGALNFSAAGTFINNGTFNNTVTGGIVFNAAGTLTNNGTFNSNATGGLDFQSAATINNNGTFNDKSGNSFTSNGNAVTFDNNAGSVFNSFASTLDLGGAGVGTFNNAGTLNLGGNTTIGGTTTITGNYTQSDTGSLKLRTNWGAGIADNLSVTGDATLGGKVTVSHTNMTGGSLTQSFTIVNATGALANNGLTIGGSTAVLTNSLSFGTNTVTINSTLNFLGTGAPITGNAGAMGRAINALFTGGSSPAFMPALINIPTTSEYVRVLQSLGPVADARGASSTLGTSSAFANQLLSCKVAGEGDAYAVIREGQCGWTRVTGRRGDTGSSEAGPGGTSSSFMISTGAQFNVGGPWRIGGGIAYEEAASNNAFARSDAQRVHLGGVVKYNPGPWLFAIGLNGGFGNSDNTRSVAIGGFNATARSSNDTDYVSGRFTTAYLMPLGGFYLKPQFDVAQTYIDRGAYTESSTGGIGLNVASSSLTVWSYAPSLELGMQTRLANNTILRPYGKIGGTWQDKGSVTTSASFAGVAGTNFSMISTMDRAFLDVGGGLDVIISDATALRIQMDGQYGENTTTHSGSAKFSLKF